MLTTIRGIIIGGVAIAAWTTPSIAFADPGFGTVDCTTDPTAPECRISVITPERPGNGSGASVGTGSGGTAGPDDGCHYEQVNSAKPPPAGASAHGGWYVRICQLPGGGVSQERAVWLDNPPAMDPAVLAREAVSRLRLAAPGIRTNPDWAHELMVQIPVWLWVDSATWGSRSATASVPGMSITATATPMRVWWELGDGSTVACAGPGTTWTVGTDPWAGSPTCGHTYRVSSAGAAGGAFTMRATVTWSVSWTGGGTSGTVPDLTTTATVAVRVAESQAVISG